MRTVEHIIETVDKLVRKYHTRDPYDAYSARTAHPFQRNGAPFRFKLSKAQQVD